MELLGPSQMRTPIDTYSHVMPALAREAAATALLGGGAARPSKPVLIGIFGITAAKATVAEQLASVAEGLADPISIEFR